MQDQSAHGKAFGSDDLWFRLNDTIRTYNRERDLYYLGGESDTEEAKRLLVAYMRAERFAEALLHSAETLIAQSQPEHEVQKHDPTEDIRRIRQIAEQIESLPLPPEEKARFRVEMRLTEEMARRSSEMEPSSAAPQPDELEQELQFLQLLMRFLQKPHAYHMTPEERATLIAEADEYPRPDDMRSPLFPVWERLFSYLASEALDQVRHGVIRVLELYELVSRTKPSNVTQSFLARLGRCYIWGFDAECVILCRAVLDTAFRDTVGDMICEKHLGPGRYSKPREFGLNERITAAWKDGMIDEETWKLARDVKMRGDKAVHYQLDVTKKVLDTIRDTLRVIEMVTGGNAVAP